MIAKIVKIALIVVVIWNAHEHPMATKFSGITSSLLELLPNNKVNKDRPFTTANQNHNPNPKNNTILITSTNEHFAVLAPTETTINSFENIGALSSNAQNFKCNINTISIERDKNELFDILFTIPSSSTNTIICDACQEKYQVLNDAKLAKGTLNESTHSGDAVSDQQLLLSDIGGIASGNDTFY